ncbi:hypothetical protein ACYOEI_33810, partial [Singulisphaera rosea]
GVVAGQGAVEKQPAEAAKTAETAPTPSKSEPKPSASRDEDIRKALAAAKKSAESVISPQERISLLANVASRFSQIRDRATAKITYRLALQTLLDNPPGPNPKALVSDKYRKTVTFLALQQGSDGFLEDAIETTNALDSRHERMEVIGKIARTVAKNGDFDGARRIVGKLDEDFRKPALSDISNTQALRVMDLARRGDLTDARRIAESLDGAAKRKVLVYIASVQAENDLPGARASVEAIDDPITRSQAWLGIARTLSGDSLIYRLPGPEPSSHQGDPSKK